VTSNDLPGFGEFSPVDHRSLDGSTQAVRNALRLEQQTLLDPFLEIVCHGEACRISVANVSYHRVAADDIEFGLQPTVNSSAFFVIHRCQFMITFASEFIVWFEFNP
jgi:hypothetical protein